MWNPERIRPIYKVMLEEMDKGIGQILDTVRSSGLAEQTLVFFFSDNGAISAGGSNQPFRGGKFSHYEGGHRVPAIAWWPGTIAPGSRSAALTLGMDLLPTFADLAGMEVPNERKLDGTSIKDVLLRQAALPERRIFFGYEPKLGTAMRDGKWKMIVKEDRVELYDLDQDRGETTNLADQQPERAARMKEEISRWKLATHPPTPTPTPTP
jgi:arylsulfatase A-like enzyme